MCISSRGGVLLQRPDVLSTQNLYKHLISPKSFIYDHWDTADSHSQLTYSNIKADTIQKS